MRAPVLAAVASAGLIASASPRVAYDRVVPACEPPVIAPVGSPKQHPPIHARSIDARGMPAPRGAAAKFDAVAENAKCEGCHVALAEEWRASFHHASATDPAYLRAYAIEPLDFCQSCHAPEDSSGAGGDARAALGTGCVTCHVVDRDVLAANEHGLGVAPHALARDPRFGTEAACVGCHEFAFPSESHAKVPMQSTISEHATSAFADTSCASCHMPRVEGHRSHRFSASRDPNMIRAAVKIAACRPSADSVRVDLSPAHVGHAFPTGDLFRRLQVAVDAEGVLARRYVDRHLASDLQRGTHDERVGVDGPLTLWFSTAGLPADAPVQWRVIYERVEHPTSDDPTTAILEGVVPIAGGSLRVGACE